LESCQQLNACRLKFDILAVNLSTNLIDRQLLVEPVYSHRIENASSISSSSTSFKMPFHSTNLNNSLSKHTIKSDNLKILRSSRFEGSMLGGDEMFLFCSTFNDIDDIEVEFFQLKQNASEVSWRAFAILDRTDIHLNSALVIRTPKYTSNTITPPNNNKKSSMLNTIENSQQHQQPTSLSSIIKYKRKVKVYYRLLRPSTKEFSEKWSFYYFPEVNADVQTYFTRYINDSNFTKRYNHLFNWTLETGVSEKSEHLNIAKKKLKMLKRKKTGSKYKVKNFIPKTIY
jgi:hypothetical protein